MVRYLTRVQLHFAEHGDHDRLHSELLAAGFSHVITGANGQNFYLPTGDYWIESGDGAPAITALAKGAAERTGRANSVVVAQYVDLQFSDLYAAV